MKVKKSSTVKVFKIPITALFTVFLMTPTFSSATDSDYVAPHVLTDENPTSVHQFMYHIKPETALVDILIKDVTFRIPRNFLSSLYKVTPTSSVSFTIMTFYPEFTGAEMEDEGLKLTEKNRIYRWMLSPNLIEMVGIEDNSSPNKANEIVFDAEKNEVDLPWQYGLLKSLKKSWNITDVYFTRPSKVDPNGYVVFCGTDELQICTIYISISSKVGVEYRFHRGLLPHWKEIHEKITALVQSFIVKKD